MENVTGSDGLTPRRMIVFPRRYRHRLHSHSPWPWEDEVDETHVTTKEADDLMTRRNLFPLPVAVHAQTESTVQNTKIKSTYTLKIPVGREIEPKDVNVKVDAQHHTVIVNAKKAKQSPDGSIRMYREVSREISLPSNVDLKDAKSFLTADGAIKIQAPFHRISSWNRNFLFPGDWNFQWRVLLLFLIYFFTVYLLFLLFVYAT